MRRIGSLLLIVGVVTAGGWAYLATQSGGSAPRYRFAAVERGPLVATVSASGNLAAVTTVQVGSQVSGQIQELLVDFNSTVKRGQVIARIAPQIFEAKVSQARAEVESAKAAVLNQEAQVERAKAEVENARATHAESRAQTVRAQVTLLDARRDLDRKSELFTRDLIARSERDSAQAAHDSAVALLDAARAKEASVAAGINAASAQFRVAEAQLAAARAQVRQKEAALQQAGVDLDHTTIRAPVNGVVVSRQVDVGQTVAASLQAPTLFTIAQDLTKMQVEASVDEADIGRVKPDDRASFTVDAFPGESFAGSVVQIRKAPQVVQNVVSYIVVVAVANPGGKLLPGMTANVRFIVAEKPSVMKISNAALRFRPPGEAGVPIGAGGSRSQTPRNAPPVSAAGGEGRRSPAEIRQQLVGGLGLDEAQQRKLDPILEDSRQQMAALRAAGLSESERQAELRKIRETARVRIREFLTVDQRARYEEMTAAAADRQGGSMPGRVWVVGADGKPKAVSVTLGLSDGTATEILRGDLTEGQQVIVGQIGATPSRPAASQGGPRLRL